MCTQFYYDVQNVVKIDVCFYIRRALLQTYFDSIQSLKSTHLYVICIKLANTE